VREQHGVKHLFCGDFFVSFFHRMEKMKTQSIKDLNTHHNLQKKLTTSNTQQGADYEQIIRL